jgi:hypothetical protein
MYAQDVRMYPWGVAVCHVSVLAFWQCGAGGDWGWRLVYVLATGSNFSLALLLGWLVLPRKCLCWSQLWREHGNPFCRDSWLKLALAGKQTRVAALAAPAAGCFDQSGLANQWDWLAQRYGAPGPSDVIALFYPTLRYVFPGDLIVALGVLALFGGAAVWGVWWAMGRVSRRETQAGPGFTLLALICVVCLLCSGQRYSVWVRDT